jgi:hypothetical protein
MNNYTTLATKHGMRLHRSEHRERREKVRMEMEMEKVIRGVNLESDGEKKFKIKQINNKWRFIKLENTKV